MHVGVRCLVVQLNPGHGGGDESRLGHSVVSASPTVLVVVEIDHRCCASDAVPQLLDFNRINVVGQQCEVWILAGPIEHQFVGPDPLVGVLVSIHRLQQPPHDGGTVGDDGAHERGGAIAVLAVHARAALEQQLDPVHLAKPTALGPMLEIELDLVDGRVKFIPEVGPGPGELRTIFRDWCMNFDDVALQVKRLDTGEGTYLRELMEDMEVMGYISCIEQRLNLTEQRCHKLKRNYELYDYLWTTDLNEMFAEFLETAIIKPEAASVASGEDLPEEEPEPERLNLELFEEKIQLYQGVQHEVDDMKPTHEIDFLRIQSQPVKQALSTWCGRGVCQLRVDGVSVVSRHLSTIDGAVRESTEAVSRSYVCHAGATSGCSVLPIICKRSS